MLLQAGDRQVRGVGPADARGTVCAQGVNLYPAAQAHLGHQQHKHIIYVLIIYTFLGLTTLSPVVSFVRYIVVLSYNVNVTCYKTVLNPPVLFSMVSGDTRRSPAGPQTSLRLGGRVDW